MAGGYSKRRACCGDSLTARSRAILKDVLRAVFEHENDALPGGRLSRLEMQRPRTGAMVMAIGLILAFSLAPAAALAAPSKAALEANRARIMSELDSMRIQLQGRIDQFTATGRDLQETQAEIDQVSAQLAEVDAQLARSKRGLELRAAQLYRGDRIGVIDALLSAKNIEDLIVCTHYLILVSERDANALTDARLTQSESLWLTESLNRRLDRLRGLQAKADAEREQIQADMTKAESRAALIDADIAELLRRNATPPASGVASDTGGTFNPDTVITNSNFRSQDMTATGIQAFLDKQAGPLKSYKGADHAGVRKTAAEMIADAAKHYNISPRVILVTLQKEQSLLSKRPSSSSGYDWAMGCGKTDSRTFTQYKGFGKQIWWGAQKLDKNSKPWVAGVKMTIDSSSVYPSNSSTYSLYKYTPHLHGVTSFWTLWIRYFNDNPAT